MDLAPNTMSGQEASLYFATRRKNKLAHKVTSGRPNRAEKTKKYAKPTRLDINIMDDVLEAFDAIL